MTMADAAIETAETEETAPERAKEAKRWMLLRRLATVVILVGIGWGVWYLLVGRNHVATDNAYVNAEVAQEFFRCLAPHRARRLDRFAPAVADDQAPIDAEFVALGVATEIVVIVENQNARAGSTRIWQTGSTTLRAEVCESASPRTR